MLQRILVAVVGIPLLLLVLIWLPDWATALLLAALSVVGSHELLGAVCGRKKLGRLWGFAALMGAFVSFSPYWKTVASAAVMPWLLALCIAALCGMVVLSYGKDSAISFHEFSAVLVAGLLIPAALSCLLRLRLMEYGAGMTLIVFVASFCADAAALFAGMLFGKHKLAPRVSPKKTVEGAVGGLCGGMLGMVIFRIVFFLVTEVQLPIGWCLLLGLVGALLGELGDLSFSAVKREYGIKDYGRLLPGHGGVLDRFDSVIFAAPVLWLMIDSVTLY